MSKDLGPESPRERRVSRAAKEAAKRESERDTAQELVDGLREQLDNNPQK